MNSLELPAPLQFSTDTSHWDEVRRIYRRVCVLRHLGKDEEAALLETRDLSRALKAARAVSDSESEEAAVLATEFERVSNASVVAELLAPLLAERLQRCLPAALAPAIADGPSASAPSQTQPARTEISTPAADGKPPSIADLIDGMLSQEAPNPR